MYNILSKIILLSLTVSLLSCDLLTTRKAEDPQFGRSSYIIATTPEQLFNNLQNSFREKIEQDYLSNFVDSSFLQIDYKFIPSSEAIVKYDILSQWDLKAEKTYFKNLINSLKDGESIQISFDFISNSVEGNGEIHNLNYTILVPFISEDIETIYKGNSLFKINRDSNNQWVITEWIDSKTENYPSWSELKGRFYLF